jgi:hypothetical protein
MGLEHPVILTDRKRPDSFSFKKMPFLGKIYISGTPGILSRKILVEIKTVPIHIHELPHDFFPGLHLVSGNIDILFRETSLKALLKNTPITLSQLLFPANQ